MVYRKFMHTTKVEQSLMFDLEKLDATRAAGSGKCSVLNNRGGYLVQEVFTRAVHLSAHGNSADGHCRDLDHRKISIAARMSWASRRRTTREEDLAYSLFGMFSVNKPLLYGEGKKAFTRVQQEIMRTSNDESIFASGLDGEERFDNILATDPSQYKISGNVHGYILPDSLWIVRIYDVQSYNFTNRGLEIFHDSATRSDLYGQCSSKLRCN